MEGSVKFFDKTKGWGFVRASDGGEYFVHFSKIQMEGYKALDTDDIVSFDLSEPNGKGRIQALNVQPVLTRKMVENSLKEENLYVKEVTNASGERSYLVVNANDVIQTSEQGISFLELAAYAGFDTEGLSA